VNYPITKERPVGKIELYYHEDEKNLYAMQLFDRNDEPMLKLGWFFHGPDADNIKIVVRLRED